MCLLTLGWSIQSLYSAEFSMVLERCVNQTFSLVCCQISDIHHSAAQRYIQAPSTVCVSYSLLVRQHCQLPEWYPWLVTCLTSYFPPTTTVLPRFVPPSLTPPLQFSFFNSLRLESASNSRTAETLQEHFWGIQPTIRITRVISLSFSSTSFITVVCISDEAKQAVWFFTCTVLRSA